MSIVCASAKASAASERMRRERRGWGRGIAPSLAMRTRRSVSDLRVASQPPVRQSLPRGMHEHEHVPEKAREAPERAAAAPQVPLALALQRKIGNRAFGRLVARTPEDSVELLEGAILGAHVNVEQINRTLLPYSKDQDGFDKMAGAYETKTETPLQKALETHVPGAELEDVRHRVPWRGFPPPKAEGDG